MATDARGLHLTASGRDAAKAFDRAVEGYLSLHRDTGPFLKAVFEADPEMPMAHCLKSYFFMLMATASLKQRAVKAAADAAERLDGASERERAHVAAATAWSAGRKREAIVHWEGILRDHPLDVLALRLAHHGHFYEGDGQNLRDTVTRCLHAWGRDTPGYGYVKGMQAFGLEETHAYEAAMTAGREAVDVNPKDPWAIHAVAHCLEMMDTPKDGIAWITGQEDGWAGCNNFRYHLWWHRALMHLDLGEYTEVLRLYDEDLWDEESDEYLDLVNDAALLLRLELHGQDVGERWQGVAEKCKAHTNDQVLAFIDIHYAAALAGAGADDAQDLLAAMRAYGETNGDDNAALTRETGLPVAEALVAYKQGDYDRTCDLLEPRRYDFYRLGGSHAQRDLFTMVLIDAAVKGDRLDLAKPLISERQSRLPRNAWTAVLARQAGIA